jgi:ligand-binding sensor domain-containing protein
MALPNGTSTEYLKTTTLKLWVSTNKGLSRFDPLKGTFKNFEPSDGLQFQ